VKTYEQTNIVAIGAFNPAIFHPDWFRANAILPSAEVDAATQADSLLITRDFTQIRFESLVVKVTQERWEIATERLDWRRDLGPIVSSVFKVLGHSPVNIVGFNVILHRGVDSVEGVMRRWAPLADLASVVGEEGAEEPPRIGASVRAKWDGYRALVGLEPSAKLSGGVFLSQNFEKNLKGGAKELVEVAQNDWEKILERSKTVAVKLLGMEP